MTIDLAGFDEVRGLRRQLLAVPVAGQEEVVTGARTLLLRLAATTPQAAREVLLQRYFTDPDPTAGPPSEYAPLDVPVVYDGPDLAEVAERTGLTPDQVIDAHTGSSWTVGFGGFAPGFGYLVGGDPRLTVPRRSTPRTEVAAGAVGLAGVFSGIYPRSSPGGWQLIGRTALQMWSTHRTPPALLVPGREIRFHRVERAADDWLEPAPAPPAGAVTSRALIVEQPGVLTTVQDGGRPGFADIGVPRSGFADRSAAHRANALVGNGQDSALLEITLGRARFRVVGDLECAVTGAWAALSVLDGSGYAEPRPYGRSFTVPDGWQLRVGAARTGLRSYLAVAGGLIEPPVLGSAATDLLSGIGPPPAARGRRLPVGAPSGDARSGESPDPVATSALEFLPGPRVDRFAVGALDVLTGQDYTVTPAVNRIGIRLVGAHPLRTIDSRELPSEPMVVGALQVPPSGDPVILSADHPVTGGYPVIGVLTDDAADRAAQLRPGATIRFRRAPTPPEPTP